MIVAMMSRKEIMMAGTVTTRAAKLQKEGPADSGKVPLPALNTAPRKKLAPRYDASLLTRRAESSAGAAAGDRALSKPATPHDLRRRHVEQQADGDMHEALDDAEIEWPAL